MQNLKSQEAFDQAEYDLIGLLLSDYEANLKSIFNTDFKDIDLIISTFSSVLAKTARASADQRAALRLLCLLLQAEATFINAALSSEQEFMTICLHFKQKCVDFTNEEQQILTTFFQALKAEPDFKKRAAYLQILLHIYLDSDKFLLPRLGKALRHGYLRLIKVPAAFVVRSDFDVNSNEFYALLELFDAFEQQALMQQVECNFPPGLRPFELLELELVEMQLSKYKQIIESKNLSFAVKAALVEMFQRHLNDADSLKHSDPRAHFSLVKFLCLLLESVGDSMEELLFSRKGFADALVNFRKSCVDFAQEEQEVLLNVFNAIKKSLPSNLQILFHVNLDSSKTLIKMLNKALKQGYLHTITVAADSCLEASLSNRSLAYFKVLGLFVVADGSSNLEDIVLPQVEPKTLHPVTLFEKAEYDLMDTELQNYEAILRHKDEKDTDIINTILINFESQWKEAKLIVKRHITTHVQSNHYDEAHCKLKFLFLLLHADSSSITKAVIFHKTAFISVFTEFKSKCVNFTIEEQSLLETFFKIMAGYPYRKPIYFQILFHMYLDSSKELFSRLDGAIISFRVHSINIKSHYFLNADLSNLSIAYKKLVDLFDYSSRRRLRWRV